MNIFENINNRLEKLLEGDVVSFTDFKKQKYADRRKERSASVSAEIDKMMNEVPPELKGDREELYKEEPIEEGKELPAKNYKKEPAKAEVGDILVVQWGYSMRLVDYYRVISANGKSVKLEHLKGKRITDDGWTGTEVPTDKVEKDDRVDGKSFRLIPPERQFMHDIENWNVCKINGNYAEFWDGKPKHFDTLD